MKKVTWLILCGILAVGMVFVGIIYHKYFRGAGVLWQKPLEDISTYFETPTSTYVSTTSTSATNFPLKLPPGFSISIFSKDIPNPRVLIQDASGNLVVSYMNQGIIGQLFVDEEGKPTKLVKLLTGLKRPHGLAIDPGDQNILYFAEEDKISRIKLSGAEKELKKIIDLPKGGRHFTRTLAFGPDGRLYVSIGSTCDTCTEKDPRHATIYSLNKDGSDFKLYAKGLRNAVFFTWHPKTKQMWTTEMGRDFLGDTNPPDEINIVEEGKNYGWPECYGKNIQDTKFDPKNYVVNPCSEPNFIPSHIDLVAHSAPLGLAFIPENSNWPKEYWNDLLVAYHGSWNKTEPTGYKIVRIKLDDQGNYLASEDFISGWLTPKGVLGRPVDILIDKSGIMYVSDDSAGIIYKIFYK